MTYFNFQPGDKVRALSVDNVAEVNGHLRPGDIATVVEVRGIDPSDLMVVVNSIGQRSVLCQHRFEPVKDEPVKSECGPTVSSDVVRKTALEYAKRYGWCSVTKDGLRELNIDPDSPVPGVFSAGDVVRRVHGGSAYSRWTIVEGDDDQQFILTTDHYVVSLDENTRKNFIREGEPQPEFQVSVDRIREVTMRLAIDNGHEDQAAEALREVGIDPYAKSAPKPGEFEDGDLVKFVNPLPMNEGMRYRVRSINGADYAINVESQTVDPIYFPDAFVKVED